MLVVIYAFIAVQLLRSIYAEQLIQEELNKANKELGSLLEAKNDFIHAASHQLRTPLSAINGILSMVHEGEYGGEPKQEQKEAISNVITAVERLTGIVNDLLRAAQLEQGVIGAMEPGQVEPLVEQAVQTFFTNYKSKNIELIYQPPKTPLVPLMMHSSFLAQVFLNLIDNAQRYTPNGGRVHLSLTQQDQTILFTIQDTGQGLDAAAKAKLFSKFFRSVRAKTVQPNGTGLGLYIVKQIVEEHGGTITVESAGEDKGTTFTVSLPCKASTKAS